MGSSMATPESAATDDASAFPPPAVMDSRERREFILANGERILGTVLSETPEAIYIDHTTLGVLTIPRAQIAQRPIEIILINGDRIVGDIVAETADTLFVRHASLGILTVPHNATQHPRGRGDPQGWRPDSRRGAGRDGKLHRHSQRHAGHGGGAA